MKKILILSCVFPPEPVVSANLSLGIATALAEKSYEVTVISPKPTRPLGFKFDTQNNREYSFKHIVIDSYTCPESKLFGRMKESYSLGKAFAKYIKKNHHSIDIIYQNTWPLFSHFLVKNTKKVYVSQQQIFAILLIKGIPSHENLHNYSML